MEELELGGIVIRNTVENSDSSKTIYIEIGGRVSFYLVKKYGGYRIVTYLEEGDLPHESINTEIRRINSGRIEYIEEEGRGKYHIVIQGK